MRLTPHMLAAAYEFLRTTQPFSGWKLPPSDEVGFRVTRNRTDAGEYDREGDEHFISISECLAEHTMTMMATMAHEMIHLYQGVSRTETPNTTHNAQFRRLASRVCKHHGFDPKAFV